MLTSVTLGELLDELLSEQVLAQGVCSRLGFPMILELDQARVA